MIPGVLGGSQPLLTYLTAELHVLDVSLDVSLRVLLGVRLLAALRAGPLPVHLPDDLADLPLDLRQGDPQHAHVLQSETLGGRPGTFLPPRCTLLYREEIL